MLGGLLQPPPPPLFTNSREWRSARLSKDGARVAFVLAGSRRPMSARSVGCEWRIRVKSLSAACYPDHRLSSKGPPWPLGLQREHGAARRPGPNRVADVAPSDNPPGRRGSVSRRSLWQLRRRCRCGQGRWCVSARARASATSTRHRGLSTTVASLTGRRRLGPAVKATL